MKGRFWRKALAAALALLIVSGSAPIKPITDVFGDIAITANAESDTIVIEASGQTISDVTTWENCAVNITGSGTVTFSNRISISGNVTLNLEAGITLNANKGIAVHEGNSLTIDGEGTLNANIGYREYYGAAIGGSNGINAGTIIINGGNINAYGKYYAAAIGGGYHSNGGNIIINGGTVNADSETGKADGAGIGGGICGDGGNITINGGDITAKSYTGTGLGGGYKGSGGNITITGGNVTSTAGNHAAGIGGGCFGNAGTITITGGIINVTSGADGAGIGGGGTSDETPAGSGGTISINGGQITVTSSGGYGIGAGKSNYNNNNNGAEGTITLSWNESTDFINASSYKGTISFVEGKRFYYDGTTDYVTADELANKLNQKIVPAVANNNSLAFADIQMPRYYITTNGTAVDVSYDVYDYNGSKLTKGTHYTAVIKNSSNEEVSSFDQLGDYTLTVTGTGTTYTGSKSFTFSLVEWDANLSVDGSDHYINFPSDGTKKTVYLGKDQTIKVYDSEGKNGNLVPSDGRLMLYAPEGYALEVTGKTDAQFYASNEYWTWLKAYDGNDETEAELITKIDQNSDNISFASAADGMLMRFYVYNGKSATYGLDLTVKAVKATPHNITVGTADNGSIASDKATANTNESVTLTVNPADGYLLKRIIVTDTDNGTTLSTIGEDHWYSGSNTVTFKVPNKNVTITPEFTNDLTASGLSTISISPDGVKECVIPEGVTSFNIGGSPVTNGASTTVLQVPNGYRLQAAGNVNFYGSSYDNSELCIYDGSDTSATLLKKKIGYITYNNGNPDIGTQISSSNYMTIYLYEDGLKDVKFTGKINMVYSIDYDLAGGSVATENPATYTYDTNAFTLTNPTREGYEFAGWTGTGLDAASTSVTIAKGSYGNRTYTATWTPIDYNITSVTEHGTITAKVGDTSATTAHYGDTVTLDVAADTGYTVKSVKIGNTEITPVEGVYSFTMPAEDVTVMAEFEKQKFTVTWKNADGTELETDENVPYGTTPTYDGETPTKTADAMYTYSFAGWSPEISDVTGNVTYTAQFSSTAKTYTITYKVDGEIYKTESVSYGNSITLPDTPTREGYTFSGWQSDYTTMPASNIEITGTFAINQYAVTYMVDGAQYGDSATVEHGTKLTAPEAPTKNGAIFLGWTADGVNTYDFETSVTAETTLTAMWLDASGFITFSEGYAVTDNTYNGTDRDYVGFRFDVNMDNSNYTVVQHGILYGMNIEAFGNGQADANLRFTNEEATALMDKVREFAAQNTDTETTDWIEVYIGDRPEGVVYARSFIIVTDGTNKYLIYSDVQQGSYNSFSE